MIIRRISLHCLAILAFFISASQARSQSGPVSSAAPGSGGAAPPASNANPLPWKFLASPMGLLGPGWAVESIKGMGKPELWDCKKASDCTQNQVKRLVQQTLGVDLDRSKPTYVAIHVVDYGGDSGNSLSDSWYLYHSKDTKWSFQKFTSQRVYGSPSILFLFVHLNTRGLTKASEDRLRSSSAAEADALIGNTVLKDSSGEVHPLCADDTDYRFQWLGNGAVVNNYANVHYESAVVKRIPANVANLLDILKILGYASHGAAACVRIKTEIVNMWGGARIENIALPSDVTIAGYSTSKDEALKDEDRSKLQIGSVGAFNDEQLYWWDASIGIPVHKIKDLQYSSSDNTVVASQVDKQSAYAMFDLMLHPTDLSDPRSNVWPRILAGFPLASSPLDRLFAGGGFGLPFKPFRNFQFFGGATFNRSKRPATLAPGATATNAQLQNDLRIQTTPKFTFGINVPVKSVLDKLLK